jgi:hypothetical protein
MESNQKIFDDEEYKIDLNKEIELDFYIDSKQKLYEDD